MKKTIPKVIVKPHYIGAEPRDKIFKRVFTAEVQRKIKLCKDTVIQKTT